MSGPGDWNETTTRGRGKNPIAIVYLTVSAGAVVGVVAMATVGLLGIVPPFPDLPHMAFRVAGLVFLVCGFIGIGMLSGGIPPRRSDEDEADWWRANSSRAVATWAMSEGLAIVGGVFWLLAGDLIVFGCLVVGGLGLLFVNRPQRMMAE